MYQQLSNKDFNNMLAKFKGTMQHTAEDLQALLVDCMHQAVPESEGGNGSLAKMTKLVHVLADSKQCPGGIRAIKKYIEAHVDCHWVTLKDGTKGYKFIDKPSVTLPEQTWWKHKANAENGNADVKTVAVVSRVRAAITDAHKDNHKPDNPEFLAELEQLMDKYKKQPKNPQPVTEAQNKDVA